MNYVTVIATQKLNKRQSKVGKLFPVRCLILASVSGPVLSDAPGDGHARSRLLRPSKFEGHCPMIRHGCRMALMVA
ncbi:MAG: hypothetical protein BECKG1743D_GA0114223_100111, partial [Candidatus Kentron sp. G]